MQVLAIVGSYRKGGNTDIIIEQALAGARATGATTEKLFVDDFTIAACQGCMEECRPTGQCKIDDDVQAIVAKLDAADAIIFGSPVYGNYMTGQMKVLLDRLMYMINRSEIKNGKRHSLSRLDTKKRNILTVMTAGAPNKDCADDALKLIRRMFNTLPNGGDWHEIIATNINALAQITWSTEQLIQVARQHGSPEPEAAARKMKDANDEILQEAYEIGRQLVA